MIIVNPRRFVFLAALAALFCRDAVAADARALDVANSVVKIFATMRYPDPYKPWTKQAPSEVTASGVVIDGDRILTNAHVVLYAGEIQIQGNEAGDKIAATVAAVSPGIDLAVLKLDDAAFFKTHPPLALADRLPLIKDAVLAYGYPTGGASLSITKGIVSRIEFVPYNFPVSGLRIQIDAAINPGNSGGPAVVGNKMIGLTFSKLGDAENIGYIIPNEEIELFLKGIAGGRYDGKPAMYDELQTLENPALRSFLKLDKSVHGMVVHRPYRSAASYPLKQWDVISRIGDTPIDDEGMIKIGDDLRVNFQYLVQKIAKNGKLPLEVVRGSRTLHIELPVAADRLTLVTDLNGGYPSYFIYGPLVFSKATWQFLSFLGKPNVAREFGFIQSPLLGEALDAPSPERTELVVISSPFFPSDLTVGYANPAGAVVYSINGIRVKSLANLVAILRDLKDEFVTIAFEQRTGETLVFPRKAIESSTEQILTDNDVRAQGSPDMMAVWRAKPAR
ncbi:MAG TPA: trypsin-like peptidase domain-containing protein [Steroidobacteraceae bacterium]|nr:trypsin-like peptidase domain-containing protein [Steroidobacteraceae bacterium]